MTSHLLVALPSLAMAAWIVAYWRRCRTLSARGTPVARWRQACFAAGTLGVVVALSPPVDELADELLMAHMAQHLLLADIAALLVALSLTGAVLQPLLRHRRLAALRTLGHPLVALPLWVLNLYVWHLPALYELAVRNDLVHVVEHACFFAFGLNMWLPLFSALPVPEWFGNGARLGYVAAVRLAGALLANIFIWSQTVFYPVYGAGEADHGVSPLADQNVAGALMMIEGMLLTVGLFAWLVVRAADASERRQQLLELASARNLPLSEERAARAVAAGQDEALRRRLARRPPVTP